jgi:hypothetical protein
MAHRSVRAFPAALAAVVVAALALTGCSADSAVRGQLAQSAGDASSAVRSAALVLGLNEDDRLIPGVEETGLADAAKTLAEQASSVATVTANGGIAEQRDSILLRIREAQDALTDAQDAAARGDDAGAALDGIRERLDRLAQRLADASTRLEHAG